VVRAVQCSAVQQRPRGENGAGGSAGREGCAARGGAAMGSLFQEDGEMAHMADATGKLRVVVLGGGYAGSRVARNLDASKLVDVTLVDRREVMIHKIGGLRAATDPTWIGRVLVPRDQLLKNGRVVTGKVKKVLRNKVVLDDGTELDWDVLVAATGATNSSPGEPPSHARTIMELVAFYTSVRTEIEMSQNIIVIGGGVVGVELAGELRSKYPDKRIIIVHSGQTLINTSSPPLSAKAHNALLKKLERLNIEIRMGTRAELEEKDLRGKSFVTDIPQVYLTNGECLDADIIFNCVGSRLNTGIYPRSWVDSMGYMKVDQHMRVVGAREHVFAVGDITDIKENKLAYNANSGHGPVCAKNILALAKGQEPKKKYSPISFQLMAIPLGPKEGLVASSMGTYGSFVTSSVKGKSLFANVAWGVNRKKVPK